MAKRIINRDDIINNRVKKTNKTKRANGRGSIVYRPERNKPYVAQVMNRIEEVNGVKQVRYTSIGSFNTRGQAESALEAFLLNPFDVSSKIISFGDLYEAWFGEYVKTLKSDSSIRTISSTYKYCKDIVDMPIRKIGPGHLKDLINNAYIIEKTGEKKYASACTKERIKSMCNMMFDYALERRLTLDNPARAFNVNNLLKQIEMEKKHKKTFTKDQIGILWDNVDVHPFVDMVLVGIYTGFRPQELCLIETKNVNITEGYIIGGMKTKNGINRQVPIHSEIYDLIKKRYDRANELESKYLFYKHDAIDSEGLTYSCYRHRFNEVMKLLELEGFSPHCTRHTFATLSEEFGLRYRAIKLIMGHSLKLDVTNDVYIHTDYNYLKQEIENIKIRRDE